MAVLPDGRVVTAAAATGGCWCGTRRTRAPPGRARPPRGRGERRWRCCRTGGWSRGGDSTAGGCWCGTRPTRAPARPSSAATSCGVMRWRRCRTGGWPPAAAAAGGCWCGTRRSRGRPGRARPPRRRGGGGGGAAGRAGGHRRRLGDGRVLVWDPAEPGAAPAELGRHERRGERGGGAAGRAGGHRRRRGRVRLRDVQGSSPGTFSHAPHPRSLFPCPHPELASSSVTKGAESHAGRYAPRQRTRLEPGNARGNVLKQASMSPHTLLSSNRPRAPSQRRRSTSRRPQRSSTTLRPDSRSCSDGPLATLPLRRPSSWRA